MVKNECMCLSVWATITDTIDWVAYKQQVFISHSSGDQGASRFRVW